MGQVVEQRYRIEGVLGTGAMGAVYRARHLGVGREVAIKVLHDHLIEDPNMVARFEREAAIAARLDHKNVIAVLDVGETATKRKLMVLELARGVSLGKLIELDGPLSRDRIINLVAQILDGLDHAHRMGLVHRDLKPENIMVECDEHGDEIPRIVDFGIAVLRDGDTRKLTAAGLVLGTPEYMAPEHAQGRTLDPRADLFALGVITYEMLAGMLPFDGFGVDVAIANITRDPPAIAERAGVAVDPLLEAFARRLMARSRRDRFHSASAARDVLELIETHRDAASELLLGAQPKARGTTASDLIATENNPISPTPNRGIAIPARLPRVPTPNTAIAPLSRQETPMPTTNPATPTQKPLAFAETVESPRAQPCRRKGPPMRAYGIRRAWVYAIGLTLGTVAGLLVTTCLT